MKVLRLSQREDREAWLEEKRGKIGGTMAKKVKPLTRGADRAPQGIWDLIGEKLTKQAENEKPMDRGNRLEQEAIAKASKLLGIPFNDNPGMWISDLNDDISVSPDGAEPVDLPTYSAEAKALGAGKHFKYLWKARNLKLDDNPIDIIPNETGSFYKEQCLQYFVVNEKLQTHYFVLYNEDCIFEDHEIVIIRIEREYVESLIIEQTEIEVQTISIVSDIVKQLTDGL